MTATLPLDSLINDFPGHLRYFEENNPHSRHEPKYFETMRLRKSFEHASDAISSTEFVRNMRDTLSGFFRLARAAIIQLPAFERTLQEHRGEIGALERLCLGSSGDNTQDDLWNLVQRLKLTEGEARLVSGSKALHLLLPELVVPIDRAYSGAFLYRFSGEFDKREQEEETFKIAFECFRRIAERASPERYVDRHRWHTSPTKVVDNAIIGFVKRARAQFSGNAPTGTIG